MRQKVADFDFTKFSKKEIVALIRSMREVMKKARGLGLSANQVGLSSRVFVAEVDKKNYAIFNPKIVDASKEQKGEEEGCLSVPNKYGLTPRSARVVLVGLDRYGKPLKIRAWGLLARVFQHETDHLNGVLFIDKATAIHEMQNEKGLEAK